MCVWVRGGRGVRSRWLREVFGVGRRKPEGTKREGNKNCYPSARSLPFPLTLLSSSFSFVVPSTEEEDEEDEEEEEDDEEEEEEEEPIVKKKSNKKKKSWVKAALREMDEV